MDHKAPPTLIFFFLGQTTLHLVTLCHTNLFNLVWHQIYNMLDYAMKQLV